MNENKMTLKQLEKQRIKEEKERIKEEKNKKKIEEKEKKERIKEEKNKKKKTRKQIRPQLEETFTQKLTDLIEINRIQNYEPSLYILKDNNKYITHIVHIADIHIRLSVRHDEYNEIFENFYIMLREHKLRAPNTIICLCGDLLHSKDELKPNTIIQTWNFIKTLSEIFPLIIITGNHDTIEMNENKIDSITAILKDRNYTDIYYLVDSGVYVYNNLIFGVSSIIDKYILHIDKVNELIMNTTFNYDMTKIGLYHGAIDSVIINQYGTKIRGERKLSDFGAYDYMLLGDIHQFQYINKEKTCAYSSSLISQNFAETDDNHGYILWDIENKESIFCKVKNDYGYHTINMNKIIKTADDKIYLDDDLIKLQLEPVKKGYLRIEVDDTYSMKISREEFKTQITSIYPDIKITWQVVFGLEDKKTNNVIDANIDNEIENNNMMEVKQEQLINLIRRFITVKYNDIDKNGIELIIKYLMQILDESKTNNINIEYIQCEWKLIWLSFDYMYGYGPNNIIDFTLYPMNEIVGIFGDNAIGKSSLIDIIAFMLYSKSARDDTACNPKDIVNVNTDKAYGVLIIESNGVKYRIDRTCRKKWNTNNKAYSINSQLNVYKMMISEDDTNKNTFKLHNQTYILYSLTEENRLCTDDILVPIVGSYDNFITTSVLLQGNTKTFRSKTNVQKKDFLSQILNLDYFRKSENIILDRLKAYKIEHDSLDKTIINLSNKSINEIQLLVDENNNKIENNNKLVNELSIIGEEKHEKLLETKYDDPKILRDKLNNYIVKKNEYENMINDIKSIILTYNNKIANLELINKKDDIITIYNNKKQLIVDKIRKNKIEIDKYDKIKNDLVYHNVYGYTIDTVNEEINKITSIYKYKQLDIIKQINEFIYRLINSVKKSIKISYNNKTMNNYYDLINNIELFCKNMLFSAYTNENINNIHKSFINSVKQIYNKIQLNNSNINNEINKINLQINYIDNFNAIDETNHINNIINKYNIKNTNIINEIQIIILDLEKDIIYNNIKNININNLNNEYNEIINFINTNKNMLHIDDKIKNIINELYININKQKINKTQCINKLDELSTEFNNYINNKELLNILSIKKNRMEEISKIKKDYYAVIKIAELKKAIEFMDNIDKYNKNIENMDKINEFKEEVEFNNDLIIIIDLIVNSDFVFDINNMKNEIEYMNNIKQDIEYNNKINEYKNTILNEINRLNDEINKINNDEDILIYDKMMKQIDEYEILYKNIICETSRLNIIEMQFVNILDDINKIKMQLDENIDEKYDLMMHIKSEYKQIMNDIEKYKIENATLEAMNVNNINLINKLIETNDLLNNVRVEIRIYDIMAKIIHRDGIQSFLLSESLKKITNKVNNILEPFIHKTIKMEMHGDKIEINIHNANNDKIQTISGMESLMLELALKIIIGQISVMPKSSVLFIDESISVLDKHRLSSIDELFNFVKQYYSQVLLITHMKQVNNHINFNLDITKTNGYSLIYNLSTHNQLHKLDTSYMLAIDKIKNRSKKINII